jgi:hypothetical protein
MGLSTSAPQLASATVAVEDVGTHAEFVGRRTMALAGDKLTALKLERSKKPGRYSDGAGLYLQVTDAAARSWVFRCRLDLTSRKTASRSARKWVLAVFTT